MKEPHQVKRDANVPGGSTSDRNFSDMKEAKPERGVSNGSGQAADQTWNRSSVHKPKRRML